MTSSVQIDEIFNQPAQPLRAGMTDGGSGPLRLAWLLSTMGLFSLPALSLALPRGLWVFAILLVISTLLAAPRLARDSKDISMPLATLLLLVLGVLGLCVVSAQLFDLGWRDIDSRTRFLLLPWCTLWAYALQPSRSALWAGALVGIAAAFVLAMWQVSNGVVRVHGWNNAIVFAEIVLMLMILVVFCRPIRSWRWVIGAWLLGIVSIVLSGSRGAWPGVALLMLVAGLGASWKTVRIRMLVLAMLSAAATLLIMTLPVISSQARIDELHQDIARYERGDVDTSLGARLELLALAETTFLQHPLTGIGMGRFEQAIQPLPECRSDKNRVCKLGHAHNDLAEWAATLGIPGVLAIVAIYALPLWWFVHLIRRSGLQRRPRGAAWAGAMLVLAYVLCGQTQSMFAHQLTTSFYAAVVAILMGLSLREAQQCALGTKGYRGEGDNPLMAAAALNEPYAGRARAGPDHPSSAWREVRILSRDNGVGLSRDLQLIAQVLDAAGTTVEKVGFDGSELGNYRREFELFGRMLFDGKIVTQLFVERVYPRFLALAHRNLLIPNPEWFSSDWLPLLPRFDRVLCKTRHAVEIFAALDCKTSYIGFSSRDRLDSAILRERAFFHLAGRSQAKGTQTLLAAWRRHPEWPQLTVVQSSRTAVLGATPGNVVHLTGYIDDARLRKLQNEHRFHLCPSEAEGFGHYLMEAMAVGAVVITTDGAPMNELVTPDRGLLIPPVRCDSLNLAPRFFVDVAGIEAAVEAVLALDATRCDQLGAAARQYFLQADTQFRQLLPQAVWP